MGKCPENIKKTEKSVKKKIDHTTKHTHAHTLNAYTSPNITDITDFIPLKCI